MAALSVPQDAILYQNPSKTIILLDLPRSISLSQGTRSHPYTTQLLSSPALQEPYLSTEPKTETAKARLLKMKSQEYASTQFPGSLLRQALEDISANIDGVWCLERKLSAVTEVTQNKKRKVGEENELENQSNSTSPTRKSTNDSPDFISHSELSLGSFHNSLDLSAFINVPDTRICSNVPQITDKLFYNPCPNPLYLRSAGSLDQIPSIHMIPPHASFFLSKINQETTLAMSMAALTMYHEPSTTAGRGQFDFVLLDPPWENRSARRAARYEIMREPEPMSVLQTMLGQHIASNGIVACWITNKTSVRDAALEAFEAWDVYLLEEWAWLKVTAKGEPVTEINGLWRKPYEILLVGRKGAQHVEEGGGDLLRRVIVGVPDLHSRKPNLKAVIEQMLPAEYRALEIFARNLTAGWWAWGDEVLKFAEAPSP